MVWRKIYSFNERKEHKIRWQKASEWMKMAKIKAELNMDPEERLRRKKKRHTDTVTRFYYRNKDRVLKQKRLRYLKNKGLSNDEIITQLLKDKTDLSNAKFDNLVI